MHLFALSPSPKIRWASAAAALLALASATAYAQPDPPAEAGRIAYISGNVSVQPVGGSDWEQAFPNLPLGPGDRIFTDVDGRAEVQVGRTIVHIAANSDVTLVDSTPEGIYIGIATGTAHVSVINVWPGQAVYVNTPNGSATMSTGTELRVEVMPEDDAAVFTNFNRDILITGAGGFEQGLQTNQSLELAGSNPVMPQWLDAMHWEDIDKWSAERNGMEQRAMSYRFVSPEIPGAFEMDAAGTWTPDTPYGAVWFPNNVQAGWAPYHYGHWVNHAPWGWVWVEDESWGYAPFHYGRWVSFNGRWGWIPGPPAEHPVWSPALVVFAGGINFGGATVSAWFPLGPGEPYRPWYPCSPTYINRVNISNITVTNVVHIQTTYVNITNVTYVNRTIGVTAMRHEDFASGRPANQVAVAVDVHQFEHVQPLPAPIPRPTAQAIVGRPPARPVPVAAARPVLINAKGMAVAARPGAAPVAPPVKAAPAVIKPLPGHAVVAAPPNAVKPPASPAAAPARMATQPPATHAAPVVAPPVKAAPEKAPEMAPKSNPSPVEKPVAPKPTAPEPVVPEKEMKAPPVKPAPVTKTPEPSTPPKVVKPATNPPAKTDKDKKDDKNKNKKDDKKDDKDKE